jgi:hypothetical protein
MLKYELKYDDLIDYNVHTDFTMVEAVDEKIIVDCINLFNSEIKWDGMFDTNEALDRIKRGEKMFVGYKNKDIFSYCWIRKIDEQSYYIYNVFSKKPKTLRKIGVMDLLCLVIKYYTKGKIICEVDEWNIQSKKITEKLGFILTN